jgi:predicted transcriptional regulator
MKEARLLKILVEEKALVKLLKTIGAGKAYPTRVLLTKLGAYGYGHKMLLKAEKRGLVDRKSVKNKVFNKLTEDGKKLVKLAREIGV